MFANFAHFYWAWGCDALTILYIALEEAIVFWTRQLVGYMSHIYKTFCICNLCFLCSVGYRTISCPFVTSVIMALSLTDCHMPLDEESYGNLQEYSRRIDVMAVDYII